MKSKTWQDTCYHFLNIFFTHFPMALICVSPTSFSPPFFSSKNSSFISNFNQSTLFLSFHVSLSGLVSGNSRMVNVVADHHNDQMSFLFFLCSFFSIFLLFDFVGILGFTFDFSSKRIILIGWFWATSRNINSRIANVVVHHHSEMNHSSSFFLSLFLSLSFHYDFVVILGYIFNLSCKRIT